MVFLYNLVIHSYALAIRLATPFSAKARNWIQGRREQVPILKSPEPNLEGCIWFHCASAGEFEARPLIEILQKSSLTRKILITFFSPAGYGFKKGYEGADLILYLPLDTRKNACDFLDRWRPSMAIFVRYEFWYHYLNELSRREIPAYLICASFQPSHWIFRKFPKSIVSAWRKFRIIFVQDVNSKVLLEQAGYHHSKVTGDTRVDRVSQIREAPFGDEVIERFIGDGPLIVFGSTWPSDDRIWIPWIKSQDRYRIIIAPHEITEQTMNRYLSAFGSACTTYSSGLAEDNHKILLLDKMGLLAYLYRYAQWAYVGGGFGKGIHNILEPAVYGIPVLIGPKCHKFQEARYLTSANLAFEVNRLDDIIKLESNILSSDAHLLSIRNGLRSYFEVSKGASEKISEFLIPANKR
jgi:3-deoxy-D-manno-octulosonic-acid transferase